MTAALLAAFELVVEVFVVGWTSAVGISRASLKQWAICLPESLANVLRGKQKLKPRNVCRPALIGRMCTTRDDLQVRWIAGQEKYLR